MSAYVLLKWIHVLMAIIAVGANLTYGVWLSRASRDPQHLPFTLRGIKLLDDRIANPAYGILLLTGFAMAGLGKISFGTPWLLIGLILYVVLVAFAAAGYTPRCAGKSSRWRPVDRIHLNTAGWRPGRRASGSCSASSP